MLIYLKEKFQEFDVYLNENLISFGSLYLVKDTVLTSEI